MYTTKYSSQHFHVSVAEILSSGSDPKEETGLLIYSTVKLFAGYNTDDARCYSFTASPTSTEWTRFTFLLKKNLDTRIFLNNVKEGTHDHPDHPGASYALNSAKVINLASSLASFLSWSVENIQLSDLSLWIDIPAGGGDWEDWAEDLPNVLGNFVLLIDRNL